MDKSLSSSTANGAPASQTHNPPHPTSTRESSSSSARRADLSQSTRPSAQASQTALASTFGAASPFASREGSPTRPSARSHAAMKTATAAATAAAAPTPASSTSQQQQSSQAPPQTAQASHKSQSPNPPQQPATPGTRSRRNSHQDASPSRASRSSIPTLAASQRPATLSAATTPTLLPSTTTDPSTTRTPAPQKSEQARDGGNPRWPVSPRLRSPPPALNRPDAATTTTTTASTSVATSSTSSSSSSAAATPSVAAEAVPPSPTASVPPSAIPAINLQRAAVDLAPTPSDSEAEDAPHPPSGMRTPMRGMLGSVPTLETVQEASPLGSPQATIDAALEKLETASIVSDAATSTVSEAADVSPVKTLRAKHLTHQYPESGSESGGAGPAAGGSSSKASRRGPTSAPAPTLTSRHSSVSKSGSGKGKAGEGSQPTMTVETETVTSIPNVTVGPASAQGVNGSLRTKPSTETIRPKKEKKKSTRKQAAVTPGTATSKADIFEAKVASAVDEANTSDSEETFVYDSNPADVRERPRHFHHSRTPSATSLATDRNGMRSIHSVLEGPGPSGVTMKKSMKFVNTFGNSSGNDSTMTGDEEMKGSAGRGTIAGSGRGTARLHHHVGGGGSHIGRWGLSGPKNGHQSIFDNESPFPVTSARLKLPHGGSNSSIGGRQNAGNTSPRPTGSVGARGGNNGAYSKRGMALGVGGGGVPLGGYDMDETTTGADDERTPLISPSMRGTRNNRSHRHPMTLRSLEQQSYHRPPASFLNRFASCLVLTVMIMLVISGAIGFMFATSQPLEDIELVKISSVIASEQELMFDLMVRAHNPNVVVVSVDAADMEVFAKSPHAGTDSEWWRRPHKGTFRTNDNGNDANTSLDVLDNEPRDQPDSSPNFLLGNFTQFDNALSFEGSFFHHGLSTSRSGVRIRRPGNGTDGGSERWERILEDEFDLIVKGVLRYSLPLSQRVRSALIEGRTTVKPNAADDPKKNETVTTSISTKDEQQSPPPRLALPEPEVKSEPPEGSSVPLFT